MQITKCRAAAPPRLVLERHKARLGLMPTPERGRKFALTQITASSRCDAVTL